MGEIVASRCMQMLDGLAVDDKDAFGMNADQVKGFVSVLRKIEDLLNNGHNSGKARMVLDNMKQIWDLAYIIEDVLETWAVEVDVADMSRPRKRRGIRRLLKRYLCGQQDDGMAALFQWEKILKAEYMTHRFHEMFPDDENARSVDEDRRNIVPWHWQTYAQGRGDHFVEMVEDLKKLINHVKDQTLRVVSIWGVEGLGKTTLARKVYIHHQVRTHFNAFAWVSLTQDYQIGNLFQNMLKQLGVKKGAEEQNKITEENMIHQLKEIQRQKRCLIVVDGISDMSQWTHISSGFLMDDGTNTRILLTTHVETIAKMGFAYKPRLLTEDEGWELLKKYAFHEKKAPDLGIIPKLGREMVKNCGYLPPKICSLGRTLSKTPLSEWHMVNDDVDRYLLTDNQSQSNERSDDVLVPKYGHLPYRLKQCFLYLGIFKEDDYVDSEDITLLWMAEGMVSPQQQEVKEGTIMDTAEQYIRELADSDMLQVQVDELSVSRRFMPLCLRNHVRKSSLYLGEKEGFRLKVVNFSDNTQSRFDPYSLIDGTRRLVIHFKRLVNSSLQHTLLAADELRSLFFLNSDEECVQIPVTIPAFEEFKLLRVVHFVRCKFEGKKLPEWVGKLVNLRYFGILYCNLDELPPSISNFRNLYVLNVRAGDDAKITLPNVLSQMIRLKHLRLPKNLDHEQSNKLKLDGLRDLETLVGFNADIHDLDSLSKLEKLRLLVTHAHSNDSLISIIKFVKDKGAHVQINLFIEGTCNFTSEVGLHILEEVLMCPKLYALTFSMVLLHEFPNCRKYASSDLTEIKLIGCKLIEDPMEALGTFPKLRKLCLGYSSFVGKLMAIHDRGFQNLEYLEFRCLPNLEEWWVDEGAMPRLSALTIKRCLKLKRIPEKLAAISSLKNLEIELASSALADGQKEKYYKMFSFMNSPIIREA